MSEFKGTPGKWALHHEYSPKLTVIKADYSEDVCECLLEADALLISHAPELLEALKEALLKFESYGDLEPTYLTNEIRSLIAKSTLNQ